MPCVSVVVSGDFCRFKLALPSLLSMSKDEVNEVNTTTDTQGMSNYFIDLTCKIFIFRNIYRCKSTILRSPYYSLQRVQIFNGSSRTSTPSHKTRDAFKNFSLAFSRDVSLGRLCLEL